jgi:hypothetical protein
MILIVGILLAGCSTMRDEAGGYRWRWPWEKKPEPEVVEPDPWRPSSGSRTFLWKPIRENANALIVLLPYTYAVVDIDRVEIWSQNNMLERAYEITGEEGVNGNHAHCRFRQSGAAYGDNLAVRVYMEAGNMAAWHVPQGAERYENDRGPDLVATAVGR